MAKKVINQGIHDFKELIESNCYYVDKSMFIHELVTRGPNKVTIIPRPRRFGKTLNMTMLKYFFEKNLDGSSNVHLFEGLAITQYPEIMARQGKYPVIFISFKGIKSSTWDGCYKKIVDVIVEEYKNHSSMLEHEVLDIFEKDFFNAIISQKADKNDYEKALKMLSMFLLKMYSTKPIILIDEYDAPMQSGFEFEYYEEIKNFMYSFFCAGLKDNNNLEFAVITGILRVAKDSLFSGMNNSASYSLLDDIYADKFGFVQSEVDAILAYFQTPLDRASIREWYNGYRVGLPKYDAQGNESFTMIYNPWSIIECVNKKSLGTHWINTGGHMLIQETMRKALAEDKEHLLQLLDGGSVEKTISDTIVFRDVFHDSNAMWSFLVFTGYLTWKRRTNMVGKTTASLITPNFEVLDSLRSMVMSWFAAPECQQLKFKKMLSGIIDGIPEVFLKAFQFNVLASVSYFDINEDGESVYQAFMLGIMVSLGDTHEITTNRESGTGRYDMCIIPHDTSQAGAIIEFKRRKAARQGPLEGFAANALDQIKEKNYTTVMHTRNIHKIAKIGLAFEGKLMAWNYEVEEDGVLVDHDAYTAEPKKKLARTCRLR